MTFEEMRLVCSYCHKVIRHDAKSRVWDVSHGMCHACAEHFDRLWKGMSLSEYLDTLPEPVVVVDGDARVVAANRKIARLFGREQAELRGLPAGEAFACVHSRLPEGCGRTVHCRECTIRRAVTRVHETGKPLSRVSAWLQTKEGRSPLRISVRKEQGLVKVVIEEVGRKEPQPAKA
jgi:PAS domain S-box-containing protein